MTIETETTYQQNIADDCSNHLTTVAVSAYKNQKSREIDDEKITQFIPLVHKLVNKVTSYLKPPLSYDDLVSAGMLGLVKAANDYSSGHNAEFQTYAYIRIRGAILDELRGWSFLPDNVNKQIRMATKLSSEFAEKHGRSPSDAELAAKMDVSVSKLHQIHEKSRAKNFVSIDSSSDDSFGFASSIQDNSVTTPHQNVEKAELSIKLAENIILLNKKQRQVIVLYYTQELTMKQIAEVLEISEPRVSQIHASAIFNLSVKMKVWKNDRE